MARSEQLKRTAKLSAPVNDAELARFRAACAKVGVEPADTIRRLAKAFALHVEEHETLTVPIRLQ